MIMKKVKLMNGDNLELLKKLPDNSVDSVVTDGPYALTSIKKRFGKEGSTEAQYGTDGVFQRASKGFMGKEWDAEVPRVDFWKEVYRVLKPGGHILSFGGTRTYHRMVVNIEDAGFEIRDQIMWIYAQGFPKSHNIKQQLEKNGYEMCECEKKLERNISETEHNLRPLSETDIQKEISNRETEGKVLFGDMLGKSLQGTFQGNIKGTEQEEGFTRREKSSVEGWSNTIQEEGELQGDNLQTSARTSETNGEEGWVYNGTQNDNGSDDGSYINENGSSSSHRPQSEQQSSKQFGTMADKRRPQESRSRKICGGCGKQVVDLTLGHTAIKPANEPICLARKPLSEKSIAENVLKWGTGGINVDGCRVGSEVRTTPVGSDDSRDDETLFGLNKTTHHERVETTEGRFPANIIFECICDEVIKNERGEMKSNTREAGNSFNNYDDKKGKVVSGIENYGDKGDIHTNPNCVCYIMDRQSLGSSRFFYQAKVSKAERNMGLDGFEEKKKEFDTTTRTNKETADKFGAERKGTAKNTHPCVKPINLLTYLCRLITPPNGIVLDPFMGSGSTGIAAQIEGFRFVGMELDEDYFKIAEARIENWEQYKKLIKEK